MDIIIIKKNTSSCIQYHSITEFYNKKEKKKKRKEKKINDNFSESKTNLD
jgi:hypothetical protein